LDASISIVAVSGSILGRVGTKRRSTAELSISEARGALPEGVRARLDRSNALITDRVCSSVEWDRTAECIMTSPREVAEIIITAITSARDAESLSVLVVSVDIIG
jgi:hypothetical protein